MKIGFLITARLKSSRLPLKLLLDLNGKSIVERVIERCKQVANIDSVILCTSTNKQDKPLVDIAQRNGVYYFLGNELDVLKRLCDAAEFFGLDYIINITGENPLFSIHHANLIADRCATNKYDFVYTENLPIGCAVYGIRTTALKVVCEVKKEVDTEIWGPLINQPDIFDINTIDGKSPFAGIRITNDYYEDYQFITALYNNFDKGTIPSFHQIEQLLIDKPELLTINSMHNQLGLAPEKLNEINAYYQANKEKILELKASMK